jgi:hypothetical protein
MTLGSRVSIPPWIAGFAILPLLFFLLDDSIARTLEAVPAVALGILIFVRLREDGYSLWCALFITAALFAQPDLSAALVQVDGPVWLSVAMFALAASAASAVERTSVRPIIVVGLSLAVLQATDPIGVFLVAAAVPLLVLGLQREANGFEAVTLAILVLFVPVVSAILLLEFHAFYPAALPVVPALLQNLGVEPPVHARTSVTLFALASVLAIGFANFIPLIRRSLFTRANGLVIALFVAVLAAFAAAELFGAKRETYWLSAALLPVVAMILATLRADPDRERFALSAALLGLALSWAAWTL